MKSVFYNKSNRILYMIMLIEKNLKRDNNDSFARIKN